MDSSRELSALLDEDNSDDGHRLAAYLLRKQGISRPQRVFGDYQPRRVSSFKIRLQKIKPTEEAQDAVINAQQPEEAKAKDAEKQDAGTEKQDADTEKQDAGTEKQDACTEKQDAGTEKQDTDTKKQDAGTEKPMSLAENQEKEINNPTAATDTAVTRNSPIPVPKSPHSATLRSPSQRLSVRKSGGMPSADRLRRYSMKRLSTISTSGRRTLLKEFDSLATDSDFLPNYCSTPMSQNPPSAPISPKTPTKQTEAAVLIDKNKTLIPTGNENSIVPESPPASEENIERLLTRLSKHDKILTELLENEPNTTYQNLEESLNRIPTTPSSKQNLSPSRSSMRHRTYNIEKGAQPGQVILTPIKTSNANNVPCATTPNRQQQQQDANDEQYPRPDNPIEEALYALHCGKTPEKTLTTAPCKSPLLASPKVLQILQRISGKKQPQMTTELISIKKSKIPSRIPLRTPLNKVEHPIQELLSSPIVVEQNYDVSDVEIPETQEQQHDVSKLPGTPLRPTTTNELLQSLQQTKSPLVIYQTFNQLPQQTESHLGVGTAANSSKMNASAGRSEDNVTTDKDNENGVTNKTFSKTKPTNNAVDKSVNTTNHIYNKTIESRSQSHKHIDTPIKTRALLRTQNSLANYIEIDDNLRFADIITDDEDDTPRPASSQHQDSNAPLNLAPPPETFIPRRKRKHCTRRQLITTDSNEPKNEMWPPRAHPLTVSRASDRIQHKQLRNAPLNAEPRTPINGEKFAKELKINLARLKNHEILDLRKRNSVGEVFTFSGRKSLAEKKDILSKQLELENQIQFEILRRNLEGNDEGLTPIYQEDDQNEGFDDMLQIPPAPDDFRDPTIQSIGIENEQQQQQALEEEDKNDSPLLAPYNSSLIDDRSCDRVSFVPPVSRRSSTSDKSRRSSRRGKKSKVPEDVQKYLDVSNNINKHKPSDKSKRHLFSQNSEELSPTRSPEASQRRHTDINIAPPLHLRVDTPSPILSYSQNTSTSRNSCELLQPLPPPKGFSDDENAIFKKPLPPSPMRNKKQKSTNKKQKKNIVSEEMSGLEPISGDFIDANNDSCIFKEPQLPSPKRGRKKKSADNKKNAPIEEEQQVEPISGDATDANNDNILFKKPQLPAPKRSRRKKTADNNNQQVVHDVAAEPQKDDEHSTLRRSKRGHMPLKNYWSFRSTDPTPLYDVRILEIRKEESRRLREMRRNNTAASIRSDSGYMPIASSTAIKNNNLQNTARGKPKKQNTKTSNYLGDTNVTSSASSECSNSSPPKSRRLAVISEPEEYVDRSRQENERQPNNELPHSTADPNYIPIKSRDVEELNIIFDQLKNASMMADKDAIMPSSSTSSKPKEQTIKNLRVRIKRVVDHEEETDNATKNLQKNKKKVVTKEKVLPTKKYQGKTTKGKGNSDNIPADIPEQQTVDAVVTEPLLTPSRNDSEALSWLRNISFANSKPGTQKLNIFEEMRCSNNLVLSNLEGLEYAYYDNDPDASVSFLRFNAHQMKPAKRAKKFNLQFLVFSGKFIFSTNKDEAEFNAGALVTINIGARYSIKNITDKQAILMVFKKAKGDA